MTVIQKEIQTIRTLLSEANGRLARLEAITKELEQVNTSSTPTNSLRGLTAEEVKRTHGYEDDPNDSIGNG